MATCIQDSQGPSPGGAAHTQSGISARGRDVLRHMQGVRVTSRSSFCVPGRGPLPSDHHGISTLLRVPPLSLSEDRISLFCMTPLSPLQNELTTDTASRCNPGAQKCKLSKQARRRASGSCSNSVAPAGAARSRLRICTLVRKNSPRPTRLSENQVTG